MTADYYFAVVRLLLRRRRRESGHPDPAELAAYVARGAGAKAREHARDHVALCASCADFVLCLTDLRPPPCNQAWRHLGAAEIRAAWWSVRTRLETRDEQ